MIYHPEKSVILTDKIGDNCVIHAPTWIGKDVMIGENVKIQAFCFLPDGVRIGDNVFIGPGVIFSNDADPPSARENWLPIWVGAGAVISAGAVIKAGVIISPKAKIGCGAVVVDDIPAGDWYVGNPARMISRTGR